MDAPVLSAKVLPWAKVWPASRGLYPGYLEEGADPVTSALKLADQWTPIWPVFVYSTSTPAEDLLKRMGELGFDAPAPDGRPRYMLFVDGPRPDVEDLRGALLKTVARRGLGLVIVEATRATDREIQALAHLLKYVTLECFTGPSRSDPTPSPVRAVLMLPPRYRGQASRDANQSIVARCPVADCGAVLYTVDPHAKCLCHDAEGRLHPLLCAPHWAKVPLDVKHRILDALRAEDMAALSQALELAIAPLKGPALAETAMPVHDATCACWGCLAPRKPRKTDDGR